MGPPICLTASKLGAYTGPSHLSIFDYRYKGSAGHTEKPSVRLEVMQRLSVVAAAEGATAARRRRLAAAWPFTRGTLSIDRVQQLQAASAFFFCACRLSNVTHLAVEEETPTRGTVQLRRAKFVVGGQINDHTARLFAPTPMMSGLLKREAARNGAQNRSYIVCLDCFTMYRSRRAVRKMDLRGPLFALRQLLS